MLELVGVCSSFVALWGFAIVLKTDEPVAHGRRKSQKLTLIGSRSLGPLVQQISGLS